MARRRHTHDYFFQEWARDQSHQGNYDARPLTPPDRRSITSELTARAWQVRDAYSSIQKVLFGGDGCGVFASNPVRGLATRNEMGGTTLRARRVEASARRRCAYW